MSSPDAMRSATRSRSQTPARPSTEARDTRGNDELNGARGRKPTRSRSPARERSRSRSDGHRERSYSRTPAHRSPNMPRSAKIVVEKLTKNVNDAHLREIFGTYGDIQELDMPTNKQFMMNKGIAYILFTQPSYAESAIAHMHEAQLDGALISVSIVLPRRRFSRSPPQKRPPPNRFGEPHRGRDVPPRQPPMADRGFGRPPPPRGGVRRSSPPRYGGRGGGGGYRDRHDDRDMYRPRSYSPSRSPPPRRRRSPNHFSRSRSPPRRRRSLSYSSYGSGSRSPHRSRGHRGR